MDRAVHGLFASPPGVSTLSTVHLSNEERRREGEVCCGKVRPGRVLQLCKTETATAGGRGDHKIFWYKTWRGELEAHDKH